MSLLQVYETNLASSGKLKLKATARLAEGDPDARFDACVLFHEAARIERRAVRALLNCPPETRLAASVEECGCLVAGRDPPQAANVWGRLLRESKLVEVAVADAMLARLTPRYERIHHEYARAVASCPTLSRLRVARNIVPVSATERANALGEVERMLDLFPGTASFWWMSYRLSEAAEDKGRAWDALTRARRLEPENEHFEAMSLLVATWALSRQAADKHLARVRGHLDTAGAQNCLMYALAELQLARKATMAERRIRWQRGRDAACAGLSQARTTQQRQRLRAAELLTEALLAGRKPTMEILYLAGLGELAATVQPKADVVEVFTSSVQKAA